MKEIELLNKKYSVELDWRPSSKKSFSKDFLAISKAEGKNYKYAYVTEHLDDVWVGLAKEKPTRSALALIAKANAQSYKELVDEYRATSHSKKIDYTLVKNTAWVVIEKLPSSSNYWVGLVKDGSPLKNGDFISDADSILITATESIANISSLIINGDVYVFVNDEELKISLSHELAYADNVKFVSQTLEEAIALAEKKSSGYVKRLSTVPQSVSFLALAVVLGIAGYFAYDWYSQMQEEAESEVVQQVDNSAKERELERKVAEYEVEKNKALIKSIENAKAWMADQISTPSAYQVIQSWNKLILQQPLNLGGWVNSAMQCQVDGGKTQCEMIFTRTPSKGTNATLIKQFPRAVIDATGDKATLSLEGDSLEKIEREIGSLVSVEEFKLRDLSRLQALESVGILKQIKEPVKVEKELDIPAPPQNVIQDMTKLPKIDFGITRTELEIAGNELYQLPGFAQELSGGSINVDKLLLDLTTGKWVIKGNYYQKVSDGNLNNLTLPKAIADKRGL